MLQSLEGIILSTLRWCFSLPEMWGFVFLGVPAIIFIFLQWVRRNETILMGALGVAFGILEMIHFMPSLKERTLVKFDELIALHNAGGSRSAVPLLEPLFSVIVGAPQSRFWHQEIFGFVIILYLGSVLINSFRMPRAARHDSPAPSLNPLGGLFGPKQKRPKRSDTNELGSGDLASNEQIMNWCGASTTDTDTIMNAADLRGSQGIAAKHARIVIPAGERNKHMLAIAKTGGGKTTQLILPILYSDAMSKNRSTIVIDSKPEMWRKLAAMTKKYNPEKNIILFNPLDRARSLSWNILAKIEDDTDAKLIANTIIMATDQPSAKSDSPFFRNNALAILNAIMVGLLHDPNDKLSMPRVHELIQGGMKPLCDWLEAHPHALRNTRTFVELARSGSQNADTIMSELSMRISAWDLSAIRATTSQNEIDLEELIEKPTLFIVELRESELEMLRPMANVIVVELLRFLTKRAEKSPGNTLKRPVSLVIDEFASALGRLPDIHVKLNTLRSRNVSIVASIQSIAQVKACYGDDADSVLAGFNTKIMIPPLDIQDAEWASKETGQMTIRFQTSSKGKNKKLIEFFASRNDGTQEQVQQRPVLTPDEIGRPVDNVSTFFLPKTPVFQGRLVPSFHTPVVGARIKESEDSPEHPMRVAPIKFDEVLPVAGPPQAAAAGGLPPGITNTKGWSEEQIRTKLDETRKKLDWENTTGSARKWWEAFENENQHRVALVLRLAEELSNRKATITEFFLAYVYSNTDNIQANLHYLDYTRLKKEEEKKKREAAEKAKAAAPAATPASAAPPPEGGDKQAAA